MEYGAIFWSRKRDKGSIVSTEGSMAWTEQEKALAQVQEKYGKTGFAEDHIGYRRVGFRRGEATVSAIGNTWDEAIAALEGKAKA